MSVALWLLLVAALLTQQPASAVLRAQEPSSPTSSALDFEFFRTKVQPIFLARREGHTRCVSCHSKRTSMRLMELSPGATTWNEEQSRKNFQVVAMRVVPRNVNQSRLLVHPLLAEAGGTFYHSGGKHWSSIFDPEWQTMAAWVRAADTPADLGDRETAGPSLDFDFFRTCVQQIFQTKREGRMECVHCHGGGARGFARSIPDGRAYWNLEESRQNFQILQRYVEPGYPLRSRFLTHPLAPEAGGDPYHGGGRRWFSQDDPEWQMLAAWVRGEDPRCAVG